MSGRKDKFIKQMKGHAGEKRTAYIEIMHLNDVPLAKDLDAEFRAAGWQTDLTVLPLYADFDGTRVMGHGNKTLVDAVADALTERGYRGVVTEPRDMPHSEDSPKYKWVINRVYVAIGNQRPAYQVVWPLSGNTVATLTINRTPDAEDIRLLAERFEIAIKVLAKAWGQEVTKP